jgi:hypothetical protein
MSIQNALNTAVNTQLSGTALTSLLAGGTAGTAYAGGTLLSVFYQQAPDNAVLPYVVFLYPSELDQNDTPHRVKDVVLRAYGVTTPSTGGATLAGTIDATIDGLLHGKSLTFSGTPAAWGTVKLMRENGYQLISTSEAGIRYYTSGADYRVILEKG